MCLQVVTGPNLSGKSCYAKQVALIVFLAHVGSYVPASEAIIGMTDRIFTRLVSSKTAGLSQSTFLIDLTQIANMLKTATSRSSFYSQGSIMFTVADQQVVIYL